MGIGLAINGGSLTATGADHAAFQSEPSPQSTDQVVLSSAGVPKLLALSALQTWLGVASGNLAPQDFSALPVVTSIAANDLVVIGQNSTNVAISYSSFLDGETIDQAAPAQPATDTDTFWVAQGSSTLLRQTFAAIWNWLETKLPTYKLPVLELSTSITLDGTVHNGRLLVCSAPLTLSPAFLNMGSGFNCEVLNLSSGSVIFAPGITTSSGQATLAPGQMAMLRGVSYSGGSVVFAAISGANAASASLPGQVTGVISTAATSNSIALTWSAPATGGTPTGYTVQYRISGTGTWSTALSGVGMTATIGGLSAVTSYDLSVTALNAAGLGLSSSILTVATAAGLTPPGQVVNLATTAATTTGITLSWSPPTSGGAPSSYSVQYAASGSSSWNTFATGITTTTTSVTGLSPATTYMFEVVATESGWGRHSFRIGYSKHRLDRQHGDVDHVEPLPGQQLQRRLRGDWRKCPCRAIDGSGAVRGFDINRGSSRQLGGRRLCQQ